MRIYSKKYISNLITRVLFIIIFLLFILILNKYDSSLIIKFKNSLFNKSFNFIKVNKVSQKLLGKDVLYYQNGGNTSLVLSNNYGINDKEKYFDGEKIKVSSNLPIGSIKSGVVVFIGNKENFNNVVIIQGMDGYNIWYGNLTNINVKLYDYIEEQNLIGTADGDYVYLLIEKNNKFYTYDEYIQNKS